MFEIGVVALFPEIVEPVLAHGVVGRAATRELLRWRSRTPPARR